MKKNNKKKLHLGKIRVASLNAPHQKAGKGASILAACNTIGGGCFPTHYNTCGDCVPTFLEC
ncbi:MAG TPA: hypothetical protein VGE79_05050 [Niastella sp.]